jgi:DNA-binding NtrC family response regulator
MKVLSVAHDLEVAEARETALREAGFDVSSARDFRQLTDLCKQHRFELAIIGHAFDPEVKRAVAAILGEYKPTPAILEIYVGQPTLQNATARLGSLDLDDLVHQVRQLMQEIRSRSA